MMPSPFGNINWSELINNSDCGQTIRDLARTKLAEQENANNHAPSKISLDPIWKETVEANERAPGGSFLQEEELVKIAAQVMLLDEYSNGVTSVSAVINENGRREVLAYYPKLVSACKNLSKDDAAAADANIVLACLYQIQRSPDDTSYDEEEKHFKNAIRLRPNDWRIHAMLSVTYVKAGDVALSLQSITQAAKLSKSAMARFELLQKKGKLLCNLMRTDDAIACLEQVLVEYEEIKDDFTPKDKGHAAVSQYALCMQYGQSKAKNRYKMQLSHWKQAEAKRAALPSDVLNTIAWDFRDMAQMFVANIKPEAALTHRECHYCHCVTDDGKRCSACKAAVYCSKDCQVKAWKSGHKKECSKESATRQQIKKDSRMSPAPAVLMDELLVPNKLWKKANALSKEGNPKEAVWYYLVALFMDFSLDVKSNLPEAQKAVEKCGDENMVARVLSIVTHRGNNPLRKCASVMESFSTQDLAGFVIGAKENAKTLDELSRDEFSLGVAYIFWGRWHARCYSMESGADQQSSKKAFKTAASCFSTAKMHINPESWLTFQYELGYSNLDIMALDEGKTWLNRFVDNLNVCQKKSGKLLPYWKQMKPAAVQKLGLISTIEKNPMLARSM
jgi:tetratricopeptide (TPR) repeat protein